MGNTKKKKNVKAIEKRREAKKQSMRRAREKLKTSPDLYEEAKKKDRERKKQQRKNISQLTEREKRKTRKQWIERAKKYRDKKKLSEQRIENICHTPPESPDLNQHLPDCMPSTSRVDSGRKLRRKNREKLKNEIKKLKKENKTLRKKANKFRQKCYRLQSASYDTPQKNVKKLLKGQNCSAAVKKSLVFSEVLSKQINENFRQEKVIKKKRNIVNIISGKIMKKYRFFNCIGSLTSHRILKHKTEPNEATKNKVIARKDVISFLEEDENSRLCAGKKETVTKLKLKKQKRFLNDTLINLHKKFTTSFPQHEKMSYSTFCSLRPFWVITPDCKTRETCLCKLHTNMSLLVKKLKQAKIIDESNTADVLKSMTCEGKLAENCLQRNCPDCLGNEIKFSESDENNKLSFHRWTTKRVEVQVKGELKLCQKTIKEEVTCTREDAISTFNCQLTQFMQHVNNIKHQYAVINNIKTRLSASDVLIHCDFSENYSCKYSEEVQSVHFGGSRNQIALHTSVVYFSKTGNETHCRSFCTVSESLRHDPVAICAHLRPVIADVKQIVPNINTINFLSDGPCTQYRNKNMFFLAATFLPREVQCKNLHWHYTEKGHGKGAPDGVGGCLKRTADSLVAQGRDISNINTIVSELKTNCTGINVYKIDGADIAKLDVHLPEDLPVFKGTLKVHEINWSQEKSGILQVRRLSCNECPAGVKCSHYGIGEIDCPKCILFF